MLLEPRGLTLGSAAGHCTGTNRFERRRAQTRYISTNSANPFAGPWASDNLSYWPQTARDFHQPPSTRAYRAYPSRTGLGWPGSVAHSMRIASVTRIFISVTTLTCFQVFSCLPMPPRTTIRCPTCHAGPFKSETSLRRHRNHRSKSGDICFRELRLEPLFTSWEPAGPAAAGRVRDMSPLRPQSPDLGDDLNDPPPGYTDDDGVGLGGRRSPSPGPAAPPPPQVCKYARILTMFTDIHDTHEYSRILTDTHEYSRILTAGP